MVWKIQAEQNLLEVLASHEPPHCLSALASGNAQSSTPVVPGSGAGRGSLKLGAGTPLNAFRQTGCAGNHRMPDNSGTIAGQICAKRRGTGATVSAPISCTAC